MRRLSSTLTVHAGLCLVGCLHLVAFTSLLFQLPYLYGRHGVQPISTVLESAQSAETQQRLAQTGGSTLAFPSLVWLHSSLGLTAEALLAAVCSAGCLLSAAAACGVVHPVVFTLLWVLYLSFKSLGGDFLDFGDEVLLEVSFAAIWLAVAHQTNKQAQQQQQDLQQEAAAVQQAHDYGPSHTASPHLQLSTVTLMLSKWLLFRLLLVTSTLSATHLCGRDPVLSSCWKTILAHGLPHAATRWLQMLPGPLAAAGAAVTVLELPVAFLVLATAPALQRMTAGALLTLQLLRLLLGPASLANLAAAVLSFLLLDDETWVPMLLGLAKRLQVPALKSGNDQQEGQEQGQAGAAEPLSRQSSITSLFGEMLPPPDELGESALDKLGWAEIAAGLGIVACSALLLSFSTTLGLLLRPSPAQLLKVLRAAVPVSMLAWFGLAIVECKEAISAALAASKAATAGAEAAAEKAAEAAADAGRLAEQSALQAAPHKPDAGASKQQIDGPLANGMHHEADTPTLTNPAADADAHDAEATDDEYGEPSKPRRGRKPAASKAGAAKAGGRAAKAAKDAVPAAESPKAGSSKARTPGKQHDKQDTGDYEQLPVSPKAAAGAGPSSSRKKAATPSAAAAVAAARLEAAQAAAAQHRQALAAAAAAQKQLQQARMGAWASTAAAVAVAAAVLAVFVAGAPQLLTAVSHDSAAVSRFFPGPVARLVQAGHSMGLTWASSTARAGFHSTQLAAAAAAGPGAVVLCEPYILSNNSSWARATLQYSLGSRQVRVKGSGVLQGLAGLRGLFQMRLQARMAAAAAGAAAGQDADGKGWLGVLASKIVKGSHDLDGLLDIPVQPHDFVRVNRVAYSPGARRWSAATLEPAAVEGQHRDSLQLASYAESYAAAPGRDGSFVALLESWTKSTSGPLVLMVLLAAVAARHLLLPGGLFQECQRAAAAAAAAMAAH